MMIRLAGLACWLVAAFAGTLLFHSVDAVPHHDPAGAEWLLALAMFMPASLGAAMLLVGPALFKPMPPPVGRCRCPDCCEARNRRSA